MDILQCFHNFDIYPINNKYFKVYCGIITRALGRNYTRTTKPDFYEHHHIVQKALTKPKQSKCVYLTCKEHLLCHHLMVKFTTDDALIKARRAYYSMFLFHRGNNIYKRNYKFTLRQLEYARRMAMIEKKDKPAHNRDENVYKFVNTKTNQVVECTRHEFAEKCHITTYDINALVRWKPETNTRKTFKSWCIEKDGVRSDVERKLNLISNNTQQIRCPNCCMVVTSGNFRRWHGDKCRNPKLVGLRGYELYNTITQESFVVMNPKDFSHIDITQRGVATLVSRFHTNPDKSHTNNTGWSIRGLF